MAIQIKCLRIATSKCTFCKSFECKLSICRWNIVRIFESMKFHFFRTLKHLLNKNGKRNKEFKWMYGKRKLLLLIQQSLGTTIHCREWNKRLNMKLLHLQSDSLYLQLFWAMLLLLLFHWIFSFCVFLEHNIIAFSLDCNKCMNISASVLCNLIGKSSFTNYLLFKHVHAKRIHSIAIYREDSRMHVYVIICFWLSK